MQEETKFIEFLRSAGLKVTYARKEVLKEVFRSHHHFDADELYLHLKKRGAKVSRATVYRTLALLVNGNLIRKMKLGDGRSTYEHILGHPHHDHLICIKCNKIVEFHHPKIEALQQEICASYHFTMLSHTQQIFGICPDCQKKEKP